MLREPRSRHELEHRGGPRLIGVLALLVLAAVFALRPARPVKPHPGPSAASASASAAPDAPLWPLAVGQRWVYREASSEKGRGGEVTVAVTAEERTGFRLVEERGGRDTSQDLIEVRADGFYYSEFETSKTPALLLPAKAPEVRDWQCRPGMRAAIVRDTEVTLGDRTYPAFDVRYEKQVDQQWREEQTLTFARGLGIARKQTPTYTWEIQRFERSK